MRDFIAEDKRNGGLVFCEYIKKRGGGEYLDLKRKKAMAEINIYRKEEEAVRQDTRNYWKTQTRRGRKRKRGRT